MIQSLPELRRQFQADKQCVHELAADDPRRVPRLSFEQQKKQAKALLSQWRDPNPSQGLAANHAGHDPLVADRVQLADAQRVIARKAGFASWAKLKHHIETADLARQALNSGLPSAPDAGRSVLHVRCGHDVMHKLAVAGFQGDFLAFPDPYVQGPVPALDDQQRFIRIRADFISANGWRTPEQAYNELVDNYQALEKGRNYESIAFWFEHDAYDVLILLKLLHFFSEYGKRAADMRFICKNHYPGVERFVGIGQLPADAMRVLWTQFKPLTDEQFEFGKLGWEAYTDNTPEALLNFLARDAPPLPEIIPALKRHLQELPWLHDGLTLSERITLTILAKHGSMNAARLFYHWYNTVYEPLPFLGDSGYWLVLDALAHAETPAITLETMSDKAVDWQVALTTFGQRLLAGEARWTAENEYDRWFGGVHNRTATGIWYWDNATGQVVRQAY
ncbi:DUF1835 domain-containing protein [Methylomonas methanica]|uniref:DUF1835 domain-containing protein n=1 Tax=Methylomonas methanica (strain DSM 25384 / MC09) TaxID=857087 RepID=G0A661_METMM|nr:DUF1835 domain-containing protein [Methylomonas methanica]AEG00511.1 hypothetical protein Metme_2106 [Methylomonas methanica MC09]